MSVDAKLQQWQNALLDMSKRNKLIYFSLDRHPGVMLHPEDPSELFQRISSSRRSLSMASIPTDLEPDDLDQKLMRLRVRAREALEDRGTNILFLAFGMLEWKEHPASDETIRSPLVLVPVQLLREGVASPFQLQLLENEEITMNPTLREKLRHDFGVDLPSGIVAPGTISGKAVADALADNSNDESMEDDEGPRSPLDATIDAILQALPDEAGDWSVVMTVCLSIFSFSKLVMYQDLKQHEDLIASHPVLGALGGDASTAQRLADDGPRLDDLDAQVRPHDTLQILNADSSQQSAIELAKEGRSFVLKGPPGTGKSQTIANIIAECLGQAKRVLFVSEKMAALEVVYQRLEEAGLSDYCLDLHSHKRDIKKSFIEELRRCLATAEHPRSPSDDITRWSSESAALFTARQELNAYVHDLHTKQTALYWSTFEVYGHLAQLHKVPDIDGDPPDPISMTAGQLSSIERSLRDLTSRSDVLVSQATHPWRDTHVATYSEQMAANIRVHFELFSQHLRDLRRHLESLNVQITGADLPLTLAGATQGLAFAEIVLRTPRPERAWLQVEDRNEIRRIAGEAEMRSDRYLTASARLFETYRTDAINLDPAPVRAALTDDAAGLMRQIRASRDSAYDRALQRAEAINRHLSAAIDLLTGMAEEAAPLANQLGLPSIVTVQEVTDMVELALHVCGSPRPPQHWLDRDEFATARVAALDAAERYQRTARGRAAILEHYEPRVFDLDLEVLDQRFRGQYTSLLRYISPAYWRDMKVMRSHLLPGVKRASADIAPDLHQARALVEEDKLLRNQRIAHATALGTFYAGDATEWEAVLAAVAWTDRLDGLLAGVPANERTKALILAGPDRTQPVRVRCERLQSHLEHWRQTLAALEDLFVLDTLPDHATMPDEVNVHSLSQWLTMLRESFRSYWQAGRALAQLRHAFTDLADRPWSQLLEDLTLIDEMRGLRAWFQGHDPDLANTFGPWFTGVETDWGKIESAIQWCDDIHAVWGGRPMSDQLLDLVARPVDDEALANVRETRDQVRALLDRLTEEWAYADRILPRASLAQTAGDFDEVESEHLAEHLSELVRALPRLEEWIDFRTYWRTCEGLGLGNFLAAVARHNPIPTNLLEWFHKRLYQLWLDGVYQTSPVLARFRGVTHEHLIERFRKLDAGHIQLARTRLLANLADHRAAALATFSKSDPELYQHLVALRAEIGKKRHRSVRTIVQKTAAALLALKPCWMVSPLSVSQYVMPELMTFDVVIFDEASQICPEDAISSILRGTQVIVVGDPKQLPPTRFFAKSISDADGEEDEQEEAIFDSILEECEATMPRRSLLWHYRSQHESLIAFSNHHFYDDSLYTFPGPQVEHTDGVQFVYVPEGRYDRGKTRTNRIEASRVVDLVFEHADRHPEQSLGVVALSEAQQSAIESEIWRRRSGRPDLDGFFQESRSNRFFVKNLESVQGDERDVIIFGVGYGKDVSGILRKTFGPINGPGGARRLNVAITRARLRIIVVSSIKAEDFTGTGSATGGARLLRDYLDYAEHGPDVLVNPQHMSSDDDNESVNLESPFEAEVYEALTQRGLSLKTQVGCSGYRIDMAVRDSSRSDRYVLGIECDGATYHSSKTARDRDRLRQQHLERLGWHIHRIWSRDWVRDREGEIEKILARLAEPQGRPAPRPVGEQAAAEVNSNGKADHSVQRTVRSEPAVPPSRPATPVANVMTLRTCETCAQFMPKTPNAFLCLQDATIKRRDPSGKTRPCLAWKRASNRAV